MPRNLDDGTLVTFIVFCVRHQKAELGFKMFIISHIAVACQDEILTVVVYTQYKTRHPNFITGNR